MAVPQLAAKSMTFVDLFMQHTRFYESPRSFWKWAAFTAIGAVLRDNCYRQLGDNKIYPNLYTLVLANSAVHRKGSPVKLCEELVKRTKSTKVISGRASIQGILDELARGETDKSTGKMLAGGSALFSAPELTAGIVNDPRGHQNPNRHLRIQRRIRFPPARNRRLPNQKRLLFYDGCK
jgi:hypothetical protein